MSTAPEPIGTEPVTPAAVGGAVEPDPATLTVEQVQAEREALQAKYDTLLTRITPLEAKAQEADRLTALINDRLGNDAPPANRADDVVAAALGRIEAQLAWQAQNGETQADRDWAMDEIAKRQFIRSLVPEFEQRMALASTPEQDLKEVAKIQSDAARMGNSITADFARAILNQRRQLADFEAKTKAAPPVVPQHTRVAPSPVPISNQGNVTYSQFSAEWPTATAARRDELRQLEKAGKVIPG